jgi:hypothetical protein
MSDLGKDIVAVFMAIIGLAMLAVVIKSQNSSGIISSVFSGFSNSISAAEHG